MATINPSVPLIGATGAFAGKNLSGTFIPTVWAASILEQFYEESVIAQIANTDYEGDIKALGDSVVVALEPDIAISDYQVGLTLAAEVPTPNKVQLNIDHGKYFNVALDDVVEAQSKPALRSAYSTAAARAMTDAVDQSFFLGTVAAPGIVTDAAAANQGAGAGVKSGALNLGTALAPVTLTATNVLPTVLALATALDEQNVPQTDRWLLIDPATRLWLMQSPVAQAQIMGDATSVARTGKLGILDRFMVYVTNKLPAAAAGQTYWGASLTNALKRRALIAGHKSAVTFATQVTKTETLRNPTSFGDLIRGLSVYGFETFRPEGLAVALVA